ncbi:MAG: septal ring factor EnvC (AmiA/AmiB activator) [Alteromonadaceae bacterium]|jgi:septal ring factor EnvC (AmiA/AmiB activator)
MMLGSVLCITSISSLAQESETQKETSKKLNNVKDSISQQQANIKDATNKRKKLHLQLKSDDLAIAKNAKEINLTQQEQQTIQKQLVKLSKQKRQFAKEKKQQEQILARQLRAAYSTGHHDYLKLMLNQENPASVQRTVTNYQYLNNARMKEIDNFKKTLDKLLLVTAEHQQQSDNLKVLAQQQLQQEVDFRKNKTQRSKTITLLNKELLNSKQLLTQLIEEEESLISALEQLAQLSQPEENLKGLSKLKHKLSWPVEGRINRSFGSEKQGYIKWKGVLMAAPVGRQVKTIHNGTVLFANWLKGYGLVTVIDHGQGYMSLYGHNQTLLKAVGERVETGEPIALVGQSGGQLQPGLYFEIRHRGQAVNPKTWCR